MLITWSSVYQYGDSLGANVNKLVWLSESNPGLVGKTERNSCKAEVRLFPSTFGFRNVKLLILVTFPIGTWKNPLVTWERLPDIALKTEW